MSSAELRNSAADLAWSLWTEMGVPGVVRKHPAAVVDPEPLIVASPAIATADPRLRDQVYSWCAAHAGRISTSRLQGLASRVTDHTRHHFGCLAATLRRHGKAQWPADEAASSWPRAPRVGPPVLSQDRPALLRFRIRGLCGVGARSDVICELLARKESWLAAAELNGEGYTKRNVARILAELYESGIASKRADRNALRYRLARPDALRSLTGADALQFPRWTAIFDFVLAMLELVDCAASTPTVRRVEAHKLREAKLAPVSAVLGISTPPTTKGVPDAWEAMLTWGAEQLRELAAGTSTALRIL